MVLSFFYETVFSCIFFSAVKEIVVLTRQNCRVNTVGNSSMTIYNKHVLERARHESEGAGTLQYEIVKEIIYYE